MRAIKGIFMGYCIAFLCIHRKTKTTLYLVGIRKKAMNSLAEQSTFFYLFWADFFSTLPS